MSLNTNRQLLLDTAAAMMAAGKGLLAMDESTPTCNKRFAALGIIQNEETRRQYRELIVTTPDLGQNISGAILCDETIRQGKKDGTTFIAVLEEAGIVPGIKVDAGAKDMAGHPGEKLTDGLDGLGGLEGSTGRLAEYFAMGARFAKWRAVLVIGENMPSAACIEANASALASYARLCQDAGLVPIVEPEVVMDGDHTFERCHQVTAAVLTSVFEQLERHGVMLEGMILKPNMVLPGLDSSERIGLDDIANTTVRCLLSVVPVNVGGVAFLSGGQSCELASARLSAMNFKFKDQLPWPLTFSFARAIQQPALEAWLGNEANVLVAQQILQHRASCNGAARIGRYHASMEK